MSITSSPAWKNLAFHRTMISPRALKEILRNPDRIEKFSVEFDGLRLVYAFQNVTEETMSLLTALGTHQTIEGYRERMFSGEKINASEDRAVLHTALRRFDETPVLVDGVDVMPEVRATRQRIAAFVDDVRSGKRKGATGKPFRFVVNIGIGGSDLGPRLVAQALKPYATGLEAHFVANADAFDIESVLQKVTPEETLFVVVSKTFTTQETLLNARAARKWIADKLGENAVASHFVAVSVNAKEVENFGVSPNDMFPTWDWVGGRFSLWSAVGLSVALAIGNENFYSLLKGAAAMDAHFVTAPLASNMPVILAMLGVWNRNFMGTSAQAVLPYSERLRDLPRYLQQLEMESNGKSVTWAGEAIDYATIPVIFGECGTVGQHSFHQCLHQGTDVIPADFIAVTDDDLNKPEAHRALLSNLAAQMGALAFGQANASKPQDIYPGNRPSNLISLEKLDPYHLGMLLALYEHKTFVQGVVWDMNSFDQPGVELGKRMAKNLEKEEVAGDEAECVSRLFKLLLR